jgi:monoamine oxidase
MKVCIVGGGISGLYLALCLTDLGHSIDIYEQSDNMGGRIMTCQESINREHIQYESGAGRFNESHKLLIKLLKKLHLFDNAQPIHFQRTFQVNSREFNYNRLINETLFKDVLQVPSNISISYLKSITLQEYMNQTIGKRQTQKIIDAFGYNSEFELQNAYTSLKIFRNDFNDNIQYYYLQYGLSQIITQLKDKVLQQDCNLYSNTKVIDYDNISNTITIINTSNKTKKTTQYAKVVFCVTKQSLLNFNTLLKWDEKLSSYLNNSIEMAPLHRIFAKFPTESDGKVWFHDVKRTTTNLPIRYIIPSNVKLGFIQISYTDKQFADYWNSFTNDTELIDELMKNLKELYPRKTITKPVWIKRHYWKEGATYWKPNYTVYKNKKNSNYYVAGEMTSQFHSAWIEGALESVHRILKLFEK